MLRTRRPEQPRRPDGAAGARQDPDADLGETEHGGPVGDSQVGRKSELEAAAETIPMERADRRLRQARDTS